MNDVINKYGLTQEDTEKIKSVFRKYPKIREVILYGSRAKGNHRKGSDIDFTIKADDMTLAELNQLSWELDDLLLPYQMDISILSHIDDPELLNHIKRVGKTFYRAKEK